MTDQPSRSTTEPPAEPPAEPLAVRYVDDVDTLQALSDPLRLAIVNLLMEGAHQEVKVRTVKELANELGGEPPTKLYRHVRRLLAVGLIQVADTRLVSGILEHRYRTGQLSLRIDEAFLGAGTPVDDTLRALGTMLDRHRDDLFAAIRAGRVRLDSGASDTRPVLAALSATIPADRAHEFAEQLTALVNEFVELPDTPDGVPVNMLVAYYPTAETPTTTTPTTTISAPGIHRRTARPDS